MRDALLAIERFDTLLEAQVLVAEWGTGYNTYRPHSALGMLTPAEFAQHWRTNHPTSHDRWTTNGVRSWSPPTTTASGSPSGTMVTPTPSTPARLRAAGHGRTMAPRRRLRGRSEPRRGLDRACRAAQERCGCMTVGTTGWSPPLPRAHTRFRDARPDRLGSPLRGLHHRRRRLPLRDRRRRPRAQESEIGRWRIWRAVSPPGVRRSSVWLRGTSPSLRSGASSGPSSL